MDRRYFLRRLVQSLPAIAGILVLTFVLIHAAPGDPILALAGEHGDAEYYRFMRQKFGLDRPVPVQLAHYARNLLKGDFGVSFIHGRPALAVVLEHLPATLLLMGSALAISTVAGVVLGTAAARRAHRPADVALGTVGLLGFAMPSFWQAQLALLTVAVPTGLFPVQGMTDARAGYEGVRGALDVLHHLALPALVLASNELALTMRLTRTGVLEAMNEDYVRTARAKGLSERTVVRRHALRSAWLPLTTVLGSRIAMFFSGAVLVEVVFAWPGLGRLLLSSARLRDFPVLLAIFFLTSTAVILGNLLTDAVYAKIDPRIRYG